MENKTSFNEIAKRPVRIITIIYAVVKALSYWILNSPYTLHRIGVGVVMVALVFAVTGITRLTQRQNSILVPMSLVIVELFFIAYMGGDRLAYYFLMGVPLLSLLYVDIKGFIAVLVLSAASTAFVVFGLDIFLMRYSSLENETFSFIGMIVLYSLFFLLSQYSITTLISARKAAERETILLADYTKTLENGYDEMRKFRHDHLDLLHGFAGFIKEDSTGDNSALSEYLQKNLDIAEKSLKVLDKSVESLQAIKIPELKGLLAVKFTNAQSEGVDVKIDIPQPVENIPLERTDLCRMVGIMVENATEELLSNSYEHKLLEFGIISNGGNIVIICTNTCKNPPHIEQIFKENFSTKGADRGIGLYNLKQICKKSGNAWVSANANKPDTFTITVTVME